jgi:hypothetical protein
MIPTWGWPDRNPPNAPQRDLAKVSHINDTLPPDWLWRAQPLLDKRPDAQRPPAIRPLALDDTAIDNQLRDKATALDAYVSVAARHQSAVEKLKNSRQILFRSNFGLVRFERRATQLFAIHEAYTAFADPDAVVPEAPKPAPFMVHEASLGPLDELPPQGELRPYAINPINPIAPEAA